MDDIAISRLTKTYGKTTGVEDLTLQVEKGEFFGFIGPNGAGKSTTIRTLLGLIRPTKGSAWVLGYNIKKGQKEILRRTGYLSSEAVFYPDMRVKELLRLSEKLHRKKCRQQADELCERLQLDPSRKIEDLSFGNRKKVGIVCALQHDPELLILDEPTSGLDPLIQHEIFQILRERNEQGTTVFLSSHILTEVEQNCTRAAIIRRGRIVACDTVEALSGNKAKLVRFRGSADISGLPGISNCKSIGQITSFLYTGDSDRLLRVLTAGNVQDLSIGEPDLEDSFLHYYQEGGAQ